VSGHVHRYRAACSWSGSTAVGYDSYTRRHVGSVPPAGEPVILSGDPAFGGDADVANPEQLLVLAASSCQMLSFLARAARARLDVRAYEDEAEAEMPEDDDPVAISSILLRPRITLAPGSDVERAREHVLKAHADCYVANSLKTKVIIEPDFAVLES
jgi:organic hydroperoxide reductase OsmC/OhrA